MKIERTIPLLDTILSDYKEIIGQDYQGYKYHVYRVVTYCLALQECTDEEREKIIIASVFHDLGIWLENSFDYIQPSLFSATEYLKSRGLETLNPEISLMISEHHKIHPDNNTEFPLVEVFRKADLIDLSLGIFKFGLEKEFIKAVKHTFPNSGFHWSLTKKAGNWFIKHPFNPLPMMKW